LSTRALTNHTSAADERKRNSVECNSKLQQCSSKLQLNALKDESAYEPKPNALYEPV
jgi:hypothetical protein